jgi:hypothetical protein
VVVYFGEKAITIMVWRMCRILFQLQETRRKRGKKVRAVQVPQLKGPFEIVEQDVPEPQRDRYESRFSLWHLS